MSKEANTKPDNDISQLGNVDQIREILFGSQSRELKEKFDKIEESIKLMHDEMRKKLEQNQLDFNSKIDAEIDGISRKIKNMLSKQHDEFSDVRESALKQEKRLQTSLENLEEELNAKREQVQKQQNENNSTLRNQMDTLKDELIEVLNSKVSELGEVKLSRDDAAEIMMEAAMAMKGTQINQQLSMAQIDTK
ncbi:hypothetical protein GJV85_04400 [Sulfurimonas aquatica]|uniref:Uncharacterized protein n=1 Tax=Sulfurimonas aquatica TaxID=2672570 RepID=A0A975GCC7_9BACT|nr:hypothetical protein [Sulfurimonas aquatica]QSZ41377.1 hypothetical protein GJV85_04400 [Sulfurimonas aquatica]